MGAGILDVLGGRFFKESGGEGQEVAGVRHWQGEDEQRIRSIIGNLDRLFNTRRGAVAHLPDYGLPDISEIYRDMPDSLDGLKEAIQAAVEKYEPRLRRVRVEHQATQQYAMRLVFILSAELVDHRKIEFQTTFSTLEPAHVHSRNQS